ncbi:hypothetical protein [Bifidobacterium choloepi]|uniref:Uncharacterized protein n=1 Tax=Bifidobacterium choloepi TaxID=2614131 RepID=A0A6I5N3Z7_9BIFI|nr:hypothetical protein [Bifidobacterium choloepi]NEG70399.1 hypothetical protein [Bifidobacterium choloepi]
MGTIIPIATMAATARLFGLRRGVAAMRFSGRRRDAELTVARPERWCGVELVVTWFSGRRCSVKLVVRFFGL